VEQNVGKLADKQLAFGSAPKEKVTAASRGAGVTEKRVEDEEAKRKALLDKISQFAETGDCGDEMRLSSELSRFDRKVVHEFATQLGLGHRSEGVDGVDRRITLRIEKKRHVSTNENLEVPIDDVTATDQDIEAPRPSVFATLGESSDESDDGEDEEDQNQQAEESAAVDHPPVNQLLASLAEERRQRQESQQVSKQSGETKKKGKPKKLGGNRAPPAVDESLDDLDDMAFLDAQIDQVQNSHGRKVEGKGAYRSIVNGILIGKPPERSETKKNVKSSSALNAKLKEAKEGRKKKVGKKK
jgi:hypothetical protein